MKTAASNPTLQKFIYFDSSEEEGDYPAHSISNKIMRQCNLESLNQKDDYQQQLKQIVQNQIEKLENGDRLIVQADDKQIEEAMRVRREKYKYFLKQIEIDSKYNAILNQKVTKIRSTNDKKKRILQQKRQKEKFFEQECQLKKIVVEKQSKQHQVLKGVQKMVHQLGIQRNTQINQQTKAMVEAERHLTSHQLASLRNKQRNELQQLKARYQEMKEAERLNKLQQAKALKQLHIKNEKLKNQVQSKLVIKKDFII